jgi:hypothetical protein
MKKNKSRDKKSKAPARTFSPYWYYALLLLVVLFFALIRIRLRDMPLERDEGEYAYAGQLILQGIPPYQLAYNMKLPGTYAAYAAVMAVFGQTPAGIHYGLVLVNAATTLLVFLLAARLFGRPAGLVAGTSYAVLSTSQAVLGFAGHATHFVVLPAVGGALLLLSAAQSKQLRTFFLSGLLMGLAFMMKQPGILFGFFGGLYILKSESQPPVDYRGLGKRLGAYSLGALLPFALTCLIMLRAGLFQKFWFWTFSYASQYGTNVSLGDGVHIFGAAFPEILASSFLLWVIAAIGLTALWWNAKARAHAGFVGWFALFSFLAVCPGLYFRQHYFILMLPAVSLLAGLAISAATERFSANPLLSAIPVLVFLGAGVYALADQREFLFAMDPVAACRATYGANPFVEAVKIADYIKRQTPEKSSIAVVGSEPEIYFYARRHSATGYVYTYPLMEEQKYASTMQHEMTSEIEAARPEFLVFVDVPVSWLVRPHSDTYIFSWAEKYLQEQYEQVGIADIGETTEYRWGDRVKGYRPASKWTVSVYKRRVP